MDKAELLAAKVSLENALYEINKLLEEESGPTVGN